MFRTRPVRLSISTRSVVVPRGSWSGSAVLLLLLPVKRTGLGGNSLDSTSAETTRLPTMASGLPPPLERSHWHMIIWRLRRLAISGWCKTVAFAV